MHVLWSEPDVTHDRQAGVREASNCVGNGASAFELDRGSAAFLEKPRCVLHRLLRGNLIRQEGHVGDHKRTIRASRHSARVINHVLQRHRDRRIQSKNHVPERVADEKQVNAGTIE